MSGRRIKKTANLLACDELSKGVDFSFPRSRLRLCSGETDLAVLSLRQYQTKCQESWMSKMLSETLKPID